MNWESFLSIFSPLLFYPGCPNFILPSRSNHTSTLSDFHHPEKVCAGLAMCCTCNVLHLQCATLPMCCTCNVLLFQCAALAMSYSSNVLWWDVLQCPTLPCSHSPMLSLPNTLPFPISNAILITLSLILTQFIIFILQCFMKWFLESVAHRSQQECRPSLSIT